MKMKVRYSAILLVLLLAFGKIANAQNKDEQLAAQFFSNAEYD